MKPRVLRHYTIASNKIAQPLTLAVLTDLHNAPFEDVLPALQGADAILLVGDLLNRHHRGTAYAEAFLTVMPGIAPTFFSKGNHEWKSQDWPAFRPLLEKSDVTLLDNRYIRFQGIALGGLSSAPQEEIRTGWLETMAQESGFRLLMCHQPEWYGRYVKRYAPDLTLSGHAHGGQICFRQQGIYAPGQGLFPKLTHGLYDGGHLLVSAGMTNSSHMPRWGNPCEILLLHLEKGETPFQAKAAESIGE